MKRMIAAVLALLLLFPALGAAVAEKEAVSVSFEQLEALVLASNPDMAALRQSYQAQRLTLETLQRRHDELMRSDAPLGSIVAVAVPLQNEMDALKLVLAYEESNLARALRQQVYLAQSQYLTHYAYELEIAAAQLDLEAAEQAHTRLRAQYAAGYAAQDEMEAAGRTAQEKARVLRALRQGQQSNLTALAAALGIASDLALGGLPPLDIEGIPDRDLEADGEAYALGAPGVRQRILELEEAERAYKLASTQVASYTRQAARENLKLEQALARQAFPQVYQALLQAFDDYGDTSRLDAAQKQFRSMQRQWELGLASANQLALAEQAFETETLSRQKQAIELYRMLLSYELNLDDAGHHLI